MLLPTIALEIGASGLRRVDRRLSLQTSMSSMPIVIVPERDQLYLQVRCRPEQQLVQTLAADGTDQSFDKWMGPGDIGNRFDFCDTEDSKIGFPLMKAI